MDAQFYYNRGVEHYYTGDYQQAAVDFTEAIALDPNSANAYNGLGVALCDLKQYEQAVKAYSQATELDPDFAIAYYNRAATYVALTNYGLAQADYVRYIFLGVKLSDFNTLLNFFRAMGVRRLW